MVGYLIEFRFQGRQGNEIKKFIGHLNRKFNISPKKRIVPHITIVPPINTKYQKRLINDFKKICKNKGVIKFKLKGYGSFEKARVVYINIEPSEEMLDLRNTLVNKLKKYCHLCPTDVFTFLWFKITKKYYPHVTLAWKLDKYKFNKILEYVKNKRPPNKDYVLTRATLLKDQKILYEYDFILNKILTRKQAKSKKTYSRTVKRLKKK